MEDKFLELAIKEAKKAYNKNEVPVGAIIVKSSEVIAVAHNLKKKTNNIMNHAEILAILRASKKIGDWRLSDCEMYVTLEPCPMCASAIQQSRIKHIYIGTKTNNSANNEIINNIFNYEGSYHAVKATYLDNIECSKLLTAFFEKKR